MVLSKTFSGLRGRKSLLCTSLVLMGTMITVTIPLPSCHELHPFQLAPPPTLAGVYVGGTCPL